MREIYSSFVRAPARYLVTVKIAIMPGISSMPIWDKKCFQNSFWYGHPGVRSVEY